MLPKSRKKRITNKETLKLIPKAQQGDIKARNDIIEGNIGLIIFIAKRYYSRIANSIIDMEDIINEGVLGMIRSIEKFKEKHKVTFSTYSSYWIRQRIERYIKDKKKIIRLPVYMLEIRAKFLKLRNDGGKTDDYYIKKISREKKIPVSRIRKIVSYVPIITHLNRTYEGDKELMENFDLTYIKGDEYFGYDDMNVKMILEYVGEKEKYILLKRAENYTLEEIGLELEISRERVRQIEKEALGRLQSLLRREKNGRPRIRSIIRNKK